MKVLTSEDIEGNFLVRIFKVRLLSILYRVRKNIWATFDIFLKSLIAKIKVTKVF